MPCMQDRRLRALRQASKLVKSHREARGTTAETAEEKDFRLRHLKDFTKKACPSDVAFCF